jgi:hypothetical protein
MPIPRKPEAQEYNPPRDRHKCWSAIRLIASEVRYVEETPGITWWWEHITIPADHTLDECPYKYNDVNFAGETHLRICHPDFPDKSKRNTWCGLAAKHPGPHMSEIAICDDNLDKDIWICWNAGEHGSRELKQPGKCKAEKSAGDSDFFCILAEGHGGEHCINDGFVDNSWELVV